MMDQAAVLRRVLLPITAYLHDLVLIGGWVPWLCLQGRGRVELGEQIEFLASNDGPMRDEGIPGPVAGQQDLAAVRLAGFWQ